MEDDGDLASTGYVVNAMLKELHVCDLALIEEALLEFGPGLNVLTGETGAGKTVLVEALDLLLGGRGDSALVRAGVDSLELEAAFEIGDDLVSRMVAEVEGLDVEGGEIIIRRIVSSSGKGRCYVNGRMCTVGTLARLGEYLVDIHGQHEHQRLLRPSSHIGYLDEYGSGEHGELLMEYRELWSGWRKARDRLEKAAMDEDERLREIDLLRFRVREIEAVNPLEGEMEELHKERRRMRSREELFSAARDAYLCIMGEEDEGGVLERLGSAEARLGKAASLDADLSSAAGSLSEAEERLADLSHELRAYMESLEFEPDRLETVEGRLHALGNLARKYGRETAEILEHLERAKLRLVELENLDEMREKMESESAAMEAKAREVSAALSASRRKLASRLTKDTNHELKELNMAGMRFEVDMEESGDLREKGSDVVEFKVSPGKGLPFRPIARIASGGELSRIMLALKLSLARADAVPTLVFDEVDAGIGGTTADVLADKLSRISRYHQVFSISHLPQIAAFSDHHMSVLKRETAGGIITEVDLLEGDRRVEELVRMLGGDESTAREHALAMLDKGAKAGD
ncbi:MAG: DNA repair protein RecN [Actinomycetota bacterium]|nr:DNA repair protein RecN [Actinomycetota bacterium]